MDASVCLNENCFKRELKVTVFRVMWQFGVGVGGEVPRLHKVLYLPGFVVYGVLIKVLPFAKYQSCSKFCTPFYVHS